MTITTLPPDAAADAGELDAAWVTALIDARAFIATRVPRLPQQGIMNVRVQGATRAEKEADLRAIAASWGTEPFERDGALIAWRAFGPLVFEAHVDHPDGSVSGCLARAAARDAQAGSRSAA